MIDHLRRVSLVETFCRADGDRWSLAKHQPSCHVIPLGLQRRMRVVEAAKLEGGRLHDQPASVRIGVQRGTPALTGLSI